MTEYLDEFGFRLEGMEAWCLHCTAGGRSAKWPQWKRREHYEANHRGAVMAAKRAATREARERAAEEARRPLAPEEAADLLRLHGDDPTPADVADLIASFEQDVASNGHRELESLRASVKRRHRRHRSGRWVAAREPRRCRECEGTFTPADPRQVYCSPKCRKRYAYRDAKNRANQPPGGGQLASRNPRSEAASPVTNRGSATPKCARCGESFDPRRTDQRFCSNACRQAAYRARHTTLAEVTP